MMSKYFLLQLKRLLRVLPFVLLSMAILVLCLYAGFNAVFSSRETDNNSRFKLALVCSDDDPYFRAGMDIVQSYDSSRFAIETFQMDENEAIKKIKDGSLDAYVVIPSGYIQNAMDGQLGSLKYVSTVGAADLSMLFKEEITAVVSDIIIACEKGMYGIAQIADEHEFRERADDISSKVSLQYVDYIIDRSSMYYVEELGIQDSVGFDGYMFSGCIVLVFIVMLTPIGAYFINRDKSVEVLLKSKGIGPLKQIIGEYFALFLICIIPAVLICTAASAFMSYMPQNIHRLFQVLSFENLLWILVVVFVISAFGYFVFQLASEHVGGILLYFFLNIGLCFVGGCFYPTYFFPDSIRNISIYIPQGVCRLILNDCISGEHNEAYLSILAIWSVVLLAASYLVRYARLRLPKR